MASSPSRSSHDQENIRQRAENLFVDDPTGFLAFVGQLFVSGKLIDDPSLDAYQLFQVVRGEFADSLVLRLLFHMENSDIDATRFHCASLLLFLHQTQRNFFSRLLSATANELKTTLIHCIDDETFHNTIDILLELFSDLAVLLLPKRRWPEAHEYLFETLRSEDETDQARAVILFERLISVCPQPFIVHVDELRESFKQMMKRAGVSLWDSVAAVEATIELVVQVETPSNHDKYHYLIDFAVGIMFDTILKGVDGLTQRILVKMIRLAEKQTSLLTPRTAYLVDNLLEVAEGLYGKTCGKTKELVVEFIATLAENKEYGCGMIQNASPVLLKRLFTVLLDMLASVECDPYLDQTDSNASYKEESITFFYTMRAFSRFVAALRENVIIRSLPDRFHEFLKDGNWQRRHAAITALGLIADGCPKASLGISGTLLTTMETLWADTHARVRWAAIQAAGLFSKNWGPHFPGQFYETFLPRLVGVLEDCDNPDLQIVAISTMLLFSKNCSSDIFRPHLKKILSILCAFLQRGNNTFKEAALTSLASLADSLQEEIQESYDAVVRHLSVDLLIPPNKSNWLLIGKTLECITIIGLAVGKKRFMNTADEVIKRIIFLQASSLQSVSPFRCYMLKAWGRLCKCLGTEFAPYLGFSLPQLLQSAQLSTNQNSNTNGSDDESYFLNEKAIACDTLCCFAEEMTAETHLWIDEIVDTFLPLLTFEFDARVRISAISAMPLMLHSASAATWKGLPLQHYRSYEKSGDIIISALSNALPKELEIHNRVRILEALDKCIQISGSCMDKIKINDFVDRIADVLAFYSHLRNERKRRVEKGFDLREKRLLKEEIELENNVYKTIASCLSSIFRIFKASILPIFEKLWPYLSLMNVMNSTEERTIVLRIFHDLAEDCGEDAFKYYEERLLLMLEACDLQNPNVLEIVAHGISICAEFGGNAFKPQLEVALSTLQGILKNPNGQHPDHVVVHEAAVVALGKICQFHFNGPDAHQAVNVWLSYLPLRNNLAQAKLVHDYLCTVIEKSEAKVLGPCPRYDDFRRIIEIFAHVMWAGNNLATDDTLDRMKKILKRFKGRILPSDFESICSSFPFQIQTMLESCLTS